MKLPSQWEFSLRREEGINLQVYPRFLVKSHHISEYLSLRKIILKETKLFSYKDNIGRSLITLKQSVMCYNETWEGNARGYHIIKLFLGLVKLLAILVERMTRIKLVCFSYLSCHFEVGINQWRYKWASLLKNLHIFLC